MSDYKLAQTKAASIVKSELAVAGINTEGKPNGQSDYWNACSYR